MLRHYGTGPAASTIRLTNPRVRLTIHLNLPVCTPVLPEPRAHTRGSPRQARPPIGDRLMRRLLFGLLVLAVGGTAAAQPPQPAIPSPRIQSVFPPGARAGKSPELHALGMTFRLDTEVTVTGTDLEEPEKLVFSHPGIKGTYIPPNVPEPDPKKKDNPPPKANPDPVTHKFRVTVDPSVPPGSYDVRVSGKWGGSNPRAFAVGNLPEVNEKEPNNDVPEAQRVEIGTTVNGVLTAGTDVDYTVFTGRQGQRVVVSC